MKRLPKTHSWPSFRSFQYLTASAGRSEASAIMITTASPLTEFSPWITARPNPFAPVFWTGTSVGTSALSA